MDTLHYSFYCKESWKIVEMESLLKKIGRKISSRKKGKVHDLFPVLLIAKMISGKKKKNHWYR